MVCSLEVWGPRSAFAAARSVSLLGVSGPGGAALADAVEFSLAELYEYVPGEVYRSASRRLQAPGASPEEVQKVAGALRLDVLVAGAVSGPKGARQLMVVIRAGSTGQVVARLRYELGSAPPLSLEELLLRDLARAFERIESGPSGRRTAEARGSDDDEGSPAAAHEAELVQTARPRLPSNIARGLQIGVGPSLFTRQLKFDRAAAQGYHAGAIAGLRVDAVVYPFALDAEFAWSHPVLAAFGVAGSYERALSLSAQSGDLASPGQAQRWRLSLIARAPLGRKRTAGELVIDAGYASESFSHPATLDLGVPDVGYDLLRVGLSAEQPLGTRTVSLGVRAAVMSLVDAGAIGSASQYGSGPGWGMEVGGGLTLWPVHWLWVRGLIDYQRIALTFNGDGARYARGALDEWIGGALEVGGAL